MSIHTAIHTSICIQSIHIHHRVQYQSILLSNGQKNELISLGTLKSDFSPLSTPFFWWRVIFFLSRNKHLGVCTYCIPSITFNSIHPINHQQLRPCRWQLVCLTSSDNSMILSHSGPLFFFFFFFHFLSFLSNSSPFYAKCRTTQKGQNWFIQNAHAIILLLNNKIKKGNTRNNPPPLILFIYYYYYYCYPLVSRSNPALFLESHKLSIRPKDTVASFLFFFSIDQYLIHSRLLYASFFRLLPISGCRVSILFQG